MPNWKDGRRPGDLALVHTLVIRSDRNTNWQIDSGFVWCSAWHGRKGGERVLTLTMPPKELALLGDLVPPLGRSHATGVGGARWCPTLGKLGWPYQRFAVLRRWLPRSKREREKGKGNGEMSLGGEQVTR